MREGRRRLLPIIVMLVLLRLVGLVSLRHPPPARLPPTPAYSILNQTGKHQCKTALTQNLSRHKKLTRIQGLPLAHDRCDSRGRHIHLPAYEEPSHSTCTSRPATYMQSSLNRFTILAEPDHLFRRQDRRRQPAQSNLSASASSTYLKPQARWLFYTLSRTR